MVLKNKWQSFLWIIVFLSLTVGAVRAHDIWTLADPMVPKPGEKVSLKMVLGHNFPAGSYLPKSDHLKVTLISPQGKTRVLPTTASGIYQQASFVPETAGAYVITADYTSYLTSTQQGPIYKPKNEVKEPFEYSNYVSQCSKIIVGAGGEAGLKPTGLNIEIVPQVDPATVKPGQVLPVQVLWKGKPLASGRDEEVEVKAVYAGFQVDEDTFAFAGHTDAQGICRIKITQMGTWMVLVEKKQPAADPAKAEKEIYIGTLVFRVSR